MKTTRRSLLKWLAAVPFAGFLISKLQQQPKFVGSVWCLGRNTEMVKVREISWSGPDRDGFYLVSTVYEVS